MDASTTALSAHASATTLGLRSRKERKMDTHYRPNEFLKLTFYRRELLLGYNFLKALYAKYPSDDLATMIKAMEANLFPKPKLIVVGSIHICCKCFCELDVRKDAYHVRTDENGVISWSHQPACPPLRPDSERER
jgi:hypothetical protein